MVPDHIPVGALIVETDSVTAHTRGVRTRWTVFGQMSETSNDWVMHVGRHQRTPVDNLMDQVTVSRMSV